MFSATFFQSLSREDKGTELLQAVELLRGNAVNSNTYIVDPVSFKQMQGSPFAYWISGTLLSAFHYFPKAGDTFIARSGGSTTDDFRFLRLFWEVSQRVDEHHTSPRWRLISKGGKFATYYADIHLLVDWQKNGDYLDFYVYEQRPREGYRWGSRSRGGEYFGNPSITWPTRSQKGFNSRVLPSGCVFSHKSPLVQHTDENYLWYFVGISNSVVFRALLQAQTAFGAYELGAIERSPIPPQPSSEIVRRVQDSFNIKRDADSLDEASHVFILPAFLRVQGKTLRELFDYWHNLEEADGTRLLRNQEEIDNIVFALYRINDVDRAALRRSMGLHDMNPEESDEPEHEDSILSNIISSTIALISHAIGCTFGRWDIRLATGEREAPPLPDPFAPLPVCSPGMLTGADGLPAQEAPSGYPLAIAWDGILVDDPGHQQDVIGRIREVLGVIWGERADAIYEEATQILAGGGHDLRPWFRQNFFDEHIKRYSKSRRKAPIYWRLATPSNSYALWLYYHRFDRDTLYKALEGYVKPKVQYEERLADTLRAEAGGNPTASQRRAIEAQEGFVEELRTFRDEIARVAPLWHPDLNDGVIINFAPLWRLTPRPRGWQKECRDTWAKLARGDYDWAHLAMHLWPARVVPKCREDRSLAIAHGLDHQFWLEGADGKWQPRHVSDATLEALIAERTSVAVQDALARLQDAPIEAAPAKRAVKQERPATRAKKGRKGDGAQQLPLG